MSNAIQTKIVILDSTGAVDLSGQANGSIRVQAIMIVPTAATWTVLLQVSDGGHTVFSSVRDGDNNPGQWYTFPKGLVISDLFVKTLTTASVHLYLADKH